MDTPTIIALIGLLLTGMTTLAGTVRWILSRIDTLHARISELRKEMADDYVSRELFTAKLDHLDRMVSEVRVDVRLILQAMRHTTSAE